MTDARVKTAPMMASTIVKVPLSEAACPRAEYEQVGCCGSFDTELTAGCRAGHGLRPWRGRRRIEVDIIVL